MKRGHSAVVSALIAALAGCGGSSADPVATVTQDRVDLITVAAYPLDHLSLVIAGTVANRQPVGHSLPMARVAIASLAPEGEPIDVGGSLATLDPGLAQYLIDQSQLRIHEEEQQIRLTALRTASQLDSLRERKTDLETQVAIYDAAIAATGSKDSSQLEIARLQLAQAEDAFARAESRLKNLEPLVAAGHESPATLARARDERTTADIGVRLPRLRLELIEQTTNSVTRSRLQMSRAQTLEELGGPEGDRGVVSEIRALEILLEKQALIKGERIQGMVRDNTIRKQVIDHPLIEARAAGLVRYRHSLVRVGSKLTASFFAYVLEDEQTVVTFALPDEWRELVRPWSQDDPKAGLVDLRLDAVPGKVFVGRVLSIAAVPEAGRDGTRAFACAVALDRADAELRVGMRVECALRVPLDRPIAVIPTWCIDDLRHPRATTADGEQRHLEGYAVGHEFVVTAGLSPGDRIVPGGARATAGALRLSGVLTASSFVPIRLSSGEWELLESVPDGSLVKKGDVVARLSKSVSWRDAGQFAFQAEFNTAEARANLAIARITAEKDLGGALVAWHLAAIQVEGARLERLVARYGTYDEYEALAEGDLGRAQIRWSQAQSEAADVDAPDTVSARSLNERMGIRLRLETARIARDRARLEHVSALRARDYLSTRDSEETVRAAEVRAASTRASYSVARSAFQAALSWAQVRYRDELNSRKWAREQLADERVIAPRDGRVYQRLQWNGRLLRVGDAVETWEPFMMPIGGGRQFIVEVPARLFGRFVVGDRVRITIPVLGPEPRDGSITKVGAYFSEGASAREEQATRGTIGVNERVFQLTIGFELDEREQDRAAPGTTAYVDL